MPKPLVIKARKGQVRELILKGGGRIKLTVTETSGTFATIELDPGDQIERVLLDESAIKNGDEE